MLFSLCTALLCLAFLLAVYTASIAWRSNQLYVFTKKNNRGWLGYVHRPDPVLGYVPVPGSRGSHLFPMGPPLPMRYSSLGFRIPVNEDENLTAPASKTLMAFGCSFTYGDSVPAEKTFPYLLGASLNAKVYNAGVCGYGLTQMLILARKNLPVYKPNYVVVQYSPWLMTRAAIAFAPNYYSYFPVPYIVRRDSGFEIKPPPFLTIAHDLPVDYYQAAPWNWRNRLAFLKNVGIPLFLHDDFYIVRFYLKRFLGFSPMNNLPEREMVKLVYGEISQLIEANGGKMILVILGKDENSVIHERELLPRNAIIVDAHSRLLELLPSRTNDEYAKAYQLWRGDPPTVVDGHPNEAAHRIIADEIVRAVGETSPAQAA